MNWGQYGKTFSKGFSGGFSNQGKSKYFTNFTKNLHKNKYVNNFINSNLHFKAFTVSFLNTMNYQTVNFLNNFKFDSMKISSEGFSMLEIEKTQEDVSALLSRLQTMMRISSISYLSDLVLGLKGNFLISK